MTTDLEVFISYSHKDERYREQLGSHLAQLRHEGVISDWNDRKIVAGANGLMRLTGMSSRLR